MINLGFGRPVGVSWPDVPGNPVTVCGRGRLYGYVALGLALVALAVVAVTLYRSGIRAETAAATG